MGRKKDEIWEYAEKIGNQRFKCGFCERTFGGGATRIREHLAGGSPNIGVCAHVPPDVQEKARSKVEKIKIRKSESTSMIGSSGAFLASSAAMGEPEDFGKNWEFEESVKSTDDGNSEGRWDYENLYCP